MPAYCTSDASQIALDCLTAVDRARGRRKPAKRRKSRRAHRISRPQLLNRAQLDGRTNAAKAFDAIAHAIASDLGGEAALSTVQKHLVEAFAGVAITVNDFNARMALGQEINILQQSQAISTMVRLASRIGINRIAKDVTPRLSDLLRDEDLPRQQRKDGAHDHDRRRAAR